MREIDPIRIRDLLSNIAEAQSRLRELGQLSEEAFLADYRNTESAKYLLIVVTEAAIDICNHIVARKGRRAPQDYADCFDILVDLNVTTPDLTTRLKQMARFRNLIVHLYWKVDNRRVYEIIQKDLDDLDDFRQQLSTWLTTR
ncbi:MAG: type VII toxin-antitoxin system HepT family RNase toxin [Planctomycetota bacterium]|jgi:uncharacterized protein YutE (UPF0331/DUF86 family)